MKKPKSNATKKETQIYCCVISWFGLKLISYPGSGNPIWVTEPTSAQHEQSRGTVSTAEHCVSPGPPYMQVTIEDVQVNSGERAKFQAVIEGIPPPTVLWFKVRADVSLAENKDHRKDYETTFLWGNPFCTVILHLLHRILSVDGFFFHICCSSPWNYHTWILPCDGSSATVAPFTWSFWGHK